MYQITTATRRIASLKKRIRAIQGGTAASKTISILLLLIDMAQSDDKPTLTSVVSESLPHLKRGAMRDFLDIMKAHKYYQEERWNRTDSIYTFETGSRIEFFGVDTPEKVHGPRRDRLFINEANNVPYMAFDQLEVRTRQTVWLDWNPTNEFWFYTELLPNRREDIDHIILTYKDNEALDQSVIQTIEARRQNYNWWKMYGEGLLGNAEDRIYSDWQIIDEIPHEARLERRGLDFGYSVAPTALVAVYYYNGGYILDEELYQSGMLSRPIADYVKNQRDWQTLVVADSAEDRLIDELKGYGLTITPCAKGPGSVRQGIGSVQGQRISVTKQSVNLIREYRNYMWMRDKNGNLVVPNEPIKGLDHCLDAARYAIQSIKGVKDPLYEKKLRSIQMAALEGEFA